MLFQYQKITKRLLGHTRFSSASRYEALCLFSNLSSSFWQIILRPHPLWKVIVFCKISPQEAKRILDLVKKVSFIFSIHFKILLNYKSCIKSVNFRVIILQFNCGGILPLLIKTFSINLTCICLAFLSLLFGYRLQIH